MFKFRTTSNKKIVIALHAIAWIIMIIIPLYLNYAFGGGNTHRIYEFYLHVFSAAIIFYVGYKWLVPRFFLQGKEISYVVILLGIILATYLVTYLIEENFLFDPAFDAKFREAMGKVTGKGENFRPPMKVFGFFNHFLWSVLLSGFALGLGVTEKLKQNEAKQKELEKEKLNSELAFLKNQVSPHFFFNTLNNIYSLIGSDGPAAQESVLKLSKMMRYLLYESEHGETPISHEIDFMNNYIDLMKLRLSPKVDLQVNFPATFPDTSFPPLLFIPFIENAFKHGVSYREQSFIHIDMLINQNQIIFKTKNSIGAKVQSGDLQHSGIGLDNVKKRLGLLFPGKHELIITPDESVFSVVLFIQKEKTT